MCHERPPGLYEEDAQMASGRRVGMIMSKTA